MVKRKQPKLQGGSNGSTAQSDDTWKLKLKVLRKQDPTTSIEFCFMACPAAKNYDQAIRSVAESFLERGVDTTDMYNYAMGQEVKNMDKEVIMLKFDLVFARSSKGSAIDGKIVKVAKAVNGIILKRHPAWRCIGPWGSRYQYRFT
jgi:hypothetical protein